MRFSGGDELLEGFGSVVGAMVDATGARTEDCGVVDMVRYPAVGLRNCQLTMEFVGVSGSICESAGKGAAVEKERGGVDGHN